MYLQVLGLALSSPSKQKSWKLDRRKTYSLSEKLSLSMLLAIDPNANMPTRLLKLSKIEFDVCLSLRSDSKHLIRNQGFENRICEKFLS